MSITRGIKQFTQSLSVPSSSVHSQSNTHTNAFFDPLITFVRSRASLRQSVAINPSFYLGKASKPDSPSTKRIDCIKRMSTNNKESERDRNNGTRAIAEQQKQKKRYEAPVQLGASYAQIIGLGTDTDGKDSTPSVLLFTDKRRYCFNVSEGFQRFCVEHKMKMTRLDRVFFTRTTARTSGGLVGMLLTLADASGIERPYLANATKYNNNNNNNDDSNNFNESEKLPKMTVHGPNVWNLLEAVKVLVAENRGIIVERGGDSFQDEICEVKPMLRVPEAIGPLGKRLSVEEEVEITTEGSVIKRELEQTISYEVQLATAPGKFDAKKADLLGVPRGKERGLLVRGESIEIKNELGVTMTITPEMCVESATRGARFAVLDLPTKAHIEAAIKITEKYISNDSWDVNADRDLVVHLAPADVSDSEVYLEFVRTNFTNPKTKHVFANSLRNERTPIFLASRELQAKLHGVDTSVFPEPISSSSSSLSISLIKSNDDSLVFGRAGNSLLKFTLTPQRCMGFDESSLPNVKTTKLIRDEAARDVVTRKLNNKIHSVIDGNNRSNASSEFFTNHSGHKVVNDVAENEVVVTFLGTGSAQPAKHRNVTGILLEIEKDNIVHSMLLDSGEGSLGQIYRSKNGNVKVVDELLMNMNFVWISHVHADHHVGLPSILSKRREAFLNSGTKEDDIPKLTVFGPRPLRWFLSQCERLEQLSYRFVDCRETLLDNDNNNDNNIYDGKAVMVVENFLSKKSPITKLQSIPVTHCAHAFGIKLEGFTNKSNVPYSIVYSGDTRPCENMRNAAKECTLLIHEATFENGLEHEAVSKKHSTTAEALEIGSTAYLNILTHFSQRYPKVPSFNEDDGIASERGQNAMIAFDLMRVDFKDLTRLPLLLPRIRELFSENDDEEDDEETDNK